jgi:hypothetical protein
VGTHEYAKRSPRLAARDESTIGLVYFHHGLLAMPHKVSKTGNDNLKKLVILCLDFSRSVPDAFFEKEINIAWVFLKRIMKRNV